MSCKICGNIIENSNKKVCPDCLIKYSIFYSEKSNLSKEDYQLIDKNDDLVKNNKEYNIKDRENYINHRSIDYNLENIRVKFKNITLGKAGIYIATNSNLSSVYEKNTYVLFNYRNFVIAKIKLKDPRFKEKYKFIYNISGQIQGSDNIYNIRIPVYANEDISKYATEWEYSAFEYFVTLWNKHKFLNNDKFYLNYNAQVLNNFYWDFIKESMDISFGDWIRSDKIYTKQSIYVEYKRSMGNIEDRYHERVNGAKRKTQQTNNTSNSNNTNNTNKNSSNQRNKNRKATRFEEYLDLFGLNSNYTKAELKREYRKLIKKYHPDNAKNDQDRQLYDEKIKHINIGYEYLLNIR